MFLSIEVPYCLNFIKFTLMNRNYTRSQPKSLHKNSHTQSCNLNKSTHQNDKFYHQNQTHFLNVSPENVHPNQSSKLTKSKFKHHFASTTELVSTPFQAKAYIPPHLSSSQVCITSECKNWQVRPSSASKKLNYNSLYNNLEEKYAKAVPCGSRLKKLAVDSKIKEMVREDRTRFEFRQPYKLFMEEKSESEEEMEYIDDSGVEESGVQSQVSENASGKVYVSMSKESRLKEKQGLVQTQI